jgi:hypothetical protein
MDNKEFLEKLKFGVGDGNLQYYIYNWKCPQMNPEKVEFRNCVFLEYLVSFSLDRLVTSIRDYRDINKNSFNYVIFFYFCFFLFNTRLQTRKKSSTEKNQLDSLWNIDI